MKTLGISGILSFTFYDSWIPFLLFSAPALFFFYRKERVRHILRQKALLKQQFLTAGDLLCDYLRSGYSIENAMQKSLAELRQLWGEKSRIAEEWESIIRGISLGQPIETGFTVFAEKAGVAEIRDFADVFAAVKRTGGQIAEVLSAAAELIQDRFRTEEQIRTMVTQKQTEQRVMDLMPIAILLFVRFSAPEMVAVLYTTVLGRLVMTACLVVYAGAFFWAEKIVRIEA